jgi:hypothetical protein
MEEATETVPEVQEKLSTDPWGGDTWGADEEEISDDTLAQLIEERKSTFIKNNLPEVDSPNVKDDSLRAREITNQDDERQFPTTLIETEEEFTIQSNLSKSEKSLIREYNKSEGKIETWEGEEYENEKDSATKTFIKFQKKIQNNPNQCLRYFFLIVKFISLIFEHIRYKFAGSPLYISPLSKSVEIPVCPKCQNIRVFEFQLLPTLISLRAFQQKKTSNKNNKNKNKISDSSSNNNNSNNNNNNNNNNNIDGPLFDFGVVCVFTCSQSCGKDSFWTQEWVYVQPPI